MAVAFQRPACTCCRHSGWRYIKLSRSKAFLGIQKIGSYRAAPYFWKSFSSLVSLLCLHLSCLLTAVVVQIGAKAYEILSIRNVYHRTVPHSQFIVGVDVVARRLVDKIFEKCFGLKVTHLHMRSFGQSRLVPGSRNSTEHRS